MRNLKLGAKIAMGFGVLIVIALLLEAMSVYNMKDIQRQSNRLAKKYVPKVDIANEVERASLATMLEMRGYAYTGEESYFKTAQEHLANVKKQVQAAVGHAQKHPGLAALKENAAKAQVKVGEYEQLAQQNRGQGPGHE